MFVNGVYPGKAGKSLKTLFESWISLEFGLCKSWKVLENSVLMSVRTLGSVYHYRTARWVVAVIVTDATRCVEQT